MLTFLNSVLCQTELGREEPGTWQTEKRMDVLHYSSEQQTLAGADKWKGKSSPGTVVRKNEQDSCVGIVRFIE